MPSLSILPLDLKRAEWEKDNRCGLAWLKSILAYCEFRAGASWRRLSDPAQRWSADRMWYLNGVRAVNDLIHAPERKDNSALPLFSPLHTTDDGLAALDRSALVARLMATSPLFSDERLLSRLPRRKLACLVARAESQRGEERWRA